MQYVGRFVSSVYNTITPNINPATLSGAIDVIVVERQVEIEVDEDEDDDDIDDTVGGSVSKGKEKRKRKIWTTELASTPFHVRFGKMSVLRPGERKVTLHLNHSSEPLPFAMKVGEQGEAFFVVEIDEEENAIPDDLVTSPILSASTSPIGSPGLEGVHGPNPSGGPTEIGTSYVEPLDLGDSRTATAAAVGAGGYASPASDLEEAVESDVDARSASYTIATSATGETDMTTPSNSRSPSADKERRQEYKPTGRPDEPDLVPRKDSGLSGSGPSAGSTSLLSHLGHAASKAGGAIGAAGRVVGVSATSNPKLEKLVRRSSKRGSPRRTGAPVDEEKGDAHEYDPGEEEADGQVRQEEGDEKTSARDGQQPMTEVEKLEEKMTKKTSELIEAEEALTAKVDLGKGEHKDREGRRASLASQASGEESYPAPFGSRGGEKKPTAPRTPVRSGSNTYPVSQADHTDFLAGKRLSGPAYDNDLGIAPAQLDSRTVEGRIQSFKEAARELQKAEETSGSSKKSQDPKSEEAHADEAQSNKHSMSRSKEDLQYMLDMDGYKMTTDGEDLAFAEGHRLADELPLSRRHGGHERHAHIGEYFDTAQRREREGISSLLREENKKEAKGEIGTSSTVKGEAKNAPLDSFLDLVSDTSPLTSRNSGHNQEDIDFSQDLAAVARALLPPVQETDDLDILDSMASKKRDGHRASGSAHQDGYHSDTDLDNINDEHVTPPSGGSGIRNRSHLRAKSGPFDYSTGRILPGDATPPSNHEDSTMSGGWSVDRAASSAPRHRVLSSGAGDGMSNPRSETLDILRQHSSTPRFRGFQGDPYTFEVILEDGSERHFAMSLCFKDGFGSSATNHQEEEEGNQAAGSDEDRDDFEENRISFQRFVEDPDVVNDERLVVLYNDRYLTWENASAVLATLSLYRKTLASARAAEEEVVLTDEPVPTQESRASVWSRWWNRNRHLEGGEDGRGLRESSAPPEVNSSTHQATPPFTASAQGVPPSMERAQSDPTLLNGPEQAHTPSVQQPSDRESRKMYAKTLRLTSDQLKSLNLRKGANDITFSVTSSYSGVATCTARIFLWEASHHIVVSDIDGTITKSDALGHVFTMIGRDWTHLGVAKLYTDIARNGYRIMYLTSRAIGQANTTRDYLRGINQNNYRLPDGPVIMSPDRLIASLHREVILRKPEVFKMACLRDIARLFGADPRHARSQPGGTWPTATAEAVKAATRDEVESTPSPTRASNEPNPSGSNPTPFYAGFGNRITDALSYRSVNIPSSRIFTIDTNGEVKMELLELAGYKSSYIHMTDLVDQMFPPITQRSSVRNAGKPEFSDFNYWRPSVGEFELPPDEDLMPSPPVSPALSARSGRSVRSTTSIRSGRGVTGRISTSNSTGHASATGTGHAGSTPSAVGEIDHQHQQQQQQQQSQGRLSRFGLGSLGLSRKGSVQTIAEPVDSNSSSSSKKIYPGGGGNGVGIIESASAPDLHADHSSSTEWAGTSPTITTTTGGGGGGGGVTVGSIPSSNSSSWISSPWRRRTASPGPGPSFSSSNNGTTTTTTTTAAIGTAVGGNPSSSSSFPPSPIVGTPSGISSPPQATSPLVGPVITADDIDSDGDGEEEYDDDDEDDDDEEEEDVFEEEYEYEEEEEEEDEDVSSIGSGDEYEENEDDDDEGEGGEENENEDSRRGRRRISLSPPIDSRDPTSLLLLPPSQQQDVQGSQILPLPTSSSSASHQAQAGTEAQEPEAERRRRRVKLPARSGRRRRRTRRRAHQEEEEEGFENEERGENDLIGNQSVSASASAALEDDNAASADALEDDELLATGEVQFDWRG